MSTSESEAGTTRDAPATSPISAILLMSGWAILKTEISDVARKKNFFIHLSKLYSRYKIVLLDI